MTDYIVKGGCRETTVSGYCLDEAVKVFVWECLESGKAPESWTIGTKEDYDNENWDEIQVCSLKGMLKEMGLAAGESDNAING